MSISSMYYEVGPLHIVSDGYITRLPQGAFFGGGGGYAQTRRPFTPDVAAVTRVTDAHNPVELKRVPVPDRPTGGLRAGVAEDFPNGGDSVGFQQFGKPGGPASPDRGRWRRPWRAD
jgi:hypothetical protein